MGPHQGRHPPSITVAAPEDPPAPQLLPPALFVPVAALIGGSVRDHDEVPGTRTDDVIAPGAAIPLVADEVAHLDAGGLRPRRRGRSGARAGRRERLELRAPVLPRHQSRSRT